MNTEYNFICGLWWYIIEWICWGCPRIVCRGASRFAFITKSRRVRWVGYVARMWGKRNSCKIVVGKPEGKIKWQVLGIDGKMVLKWILGNVMGGCELGPFDWGSHGTMAGIFSINLYYDQQMQNFFTNYHTLHVSTWAGWLSQYSDWLRAGRSGDWIQVGRDFPYLSRPALRSTQPPVQWVPDLSWGIKSGRGVALTPYPLLVPWSWKGRAIHLLPLWAVRPVQTLSACTRVTFTFTFTFTWCSPTDYKWHYSMRHAHYILDA